jgi:hypothetical protein
MTTNTDFATQIQAAKQQIEAAKAKLEKLLKQEAAADLIANVQRGDIITFVFGRKAGRAEYVGEVRGVDDTEKGRTIRVIKGTGADEQIVVIRPGDIVGKGETVTAEFSEEEAVAVYEASFMAAQNANDDPLASIN